MEQSSQWEGVERKKKINLRRISDLVLAKRKTSFPFTSKEWNVILARDALWNVGPPGYRSYGALKTARAYRTNRARLRRKTFASRVETKAVW